jgi:hypothetical protein
VTDGSRDAVGALPQRCFHRAWAYRIHAYAVRSHFLGQGLAEVGERGLGGAVSRRPAGPEGGR